MAVILSALGTNADAAIDAAVQRLRAGQLVAIPTETVYGLAADADRADAVARIYGAKGRPTDHPLIVHIGGTTAAERLHAATRYVQDIPEFAQRLMDAFWPGPLTIVLPRRPNMAQAAAAGLTTLGLRCPAHPVAHALLCAAHDAGIGGLAAPSANRFGHISPTTAQHVLAELRHLDDDALLILDGGPCPVGIESTIVDASRGVLVLLRPGMIGRAELEAAAGERVADRDAAAPRASGTLASHYAPQAKVRLMDAAELQTLLDRLDAQHASAIAIYHRSPLRIAQSALHVRRMPSDAATCARELFAVLRELDKDAVREIWVERPEADAAWEGVHDRLQRAAA